MHVDEQKLLEQRQGQPLNILVVDDEENVRDVFRDFCLSSPLFNVITAAGGREAIELAEGNNLDIVTMDLVMPEVSGLEAMETIKKQQPHLPMVIITGNATDHLIREAGRLGCRIMNKPVAIDEFMNELMELAREKCL